MLLVMGVTLYTSRVVLSVLGVDNFGIYNLVGGVVVLFTFLSASMTTATQRHICVVIGKGIASNVQQVFSSSIIAHIVLISILIIIAETIGLWFVRTQLVIPPDREQAALVVYQLSILATVINIYRIPFNASVLAYERMTIYAYMGIVEAILKLIILIPLSICDYDKLILYGSLIVTINLAITIWYILYAHYKLPNSKHKLSHFKKKYIIDIFSFASWSSFSAIANIGSRQGLNFLINIFYGVGLNATIGIMNQVSSSVYQFIGNFQSAINPPIMKDYAIGNYSRVKTLITTSAKFSFFLFSLLATPIVFNIDAILNLWLEKVPPSTSTFCVFALIALLPNTIGGSIWTLIQATGNIKRYQVFISIITLLNIPIFYLLLYFDFPPQYTIAIQFITNLIVVLIGIKFVLSYIQLSSKEFIKSTILTGFFTLTLIWITLYLVNPYLATNSANNIFEIIFRCVFDLVIAILIIYFIGLNHSEKKFLIRLIYKNQKNDFNHNSSL